MPAAPVFPNNLTALSVISPVPWQMGTKSLQCTRTGLGTEYRNESNRVPARPQVQARRQRREKLSCAEGPLLPGPPCVAVHTWLSHAPKLAALLLSESPATALGRPHLQPKWFCRKSSLSLRSHRSQKEFRSQLLPCWWERRS